MPDQGVSWRDVYGVKGAPKRGQPSPHAPPKQDGVSWRDAYGIKPSGQSPQQAAQQTVAPAQPATSSTTLPAGLTPTIFGGTNPALNYRAPVVSSTAASPNRSVPVRTGPTLDETVLRGANVAAEAIGSGAKWATKQVLGESGVQSAKSFTKVVKPLIPKIDEAIATSPLMGLVAATSPLIPAAAPSAQIGIGAANTLTGGLLQDQLPKTTKALSKSASTGSKVADEVLGAVGSTGAFIAAPEVALTTQILGSGVKYAEGKESALAALGDIALTTGGLKGFGAVSKIGSTAKRVLGSIGVSEALEIGGSAMHGQAPTWGGVIGAAITGGVMGIPGGHGAVSEATEGEHNATIAGQEEHRAEYQNGDTGGQEAVASEGNRTQRSAEVGGEHPQAEGQVQVAPPEEIPNAEPIVLPTGPLAEPQAPPSIEQANHEAISDRGPNGTSPDAQREGVDVGVPRNEEDRAHNTEVGGARAENSTGDRGDESLRQGEAHPDAQVAGTPQGEPTGEADRNLVPESFRTKYTERAVGDAVEVIPWGAEPTKGTIAGFNPETREYTLEGGGTAHESEVHSIGMVRPETQKGLTDARIVEQMHPISIREATLQYLASGRGFNREDVRGVIGKHLKTGTKSDYNPNFWKLHRPDEQSIDSFIHDDAPDRMGIDIWGERARDTQDRELDWRNEVHGIITNVHSSKQARELLASEYRKKFEATPNESGYTFPDTEFNPRPVDEEEGADFNYGANVGDRDYSESKIPPIAGEEAKPEEPYGAAKTPSANLHGEILPVTALAKDIGTGVVELAQKEIFPAVKSASQAVLEASKQIRTTLAPSSMKTADVFKGIMRENPAQLALDTSRINEQFKSAAKSMDALPLEDRNDFIDRMERGKEQDTPELEKIAGDLRSLRDAWVKKVQDLGTGKLQSLIENYFPHVWKDPAKAQKELSAFYAKAPFEGNKSFLKKRSIEYDSDGRALGLERVTDNPVELMLLKVHQMQKYVMAHNVIAEAKGKGFVSFTRNAAPDAGMSFINDRGVGYAYGNPEQSIAPQLAKILEAHTEIPHDIVSSLMSDAEGAKTDVHGVVVVGRYQMPEDAARLINNYLSPSLRGKSAAFRGYLALANHMNQFQLGWSAFHLGFNVMDAVTSRAALGVYQGAHGDVVQGLKSLASAPVAPFTQLREGNKIFNEWRKPGSEGHIYADMVKSVVNAGGRAEMDSFYRTDAWDRMKAAWRDSASTLSGIVRAGVRLPFALTEKAAAPILQYIVLRMKLGAFAQLARYDLERLGSNATLDETRAALGKAWDSVDNRLGQLVYDNLFWDKATKDIAMASVRSVGWNLGTFRELGGGVIDFGRFAKNVVTPNQRAEFTHRMSYVVALPVVSGLTGALYQYLATGDGPKELKDYFFPKDGGVDENGSPTRVSLPTYMKDVYAYKSDIESGHPTRTLQNKLHPAVSAIAEMLQNKDYYGTEIANADDPVMQKMLDYAQFGLKTFMPFAGRGIQRNIELGGFQAKSLLPLIGLTPAPKSINLSPDEEVLAEHAKAHLPQGSRTKAQSERSQREYALARQFRENPSEAESSGQQMVEQGLLRQEDFDSAKKSQSTPKYVQRLKAADIETGMKAYEVAIPSRRAEYHDVLQKKFEKAGKMPKNQERPKNMTADEYEAFQEMRSKFESLPFGGE